MRRIPLCLIALTLSVSVALSIALLDMPLHAREAPARVNATTHFENTLDARTRTLCNNAVSTVLARVRATFPWFTPPTFSFHKDAAAGTPASPWAGGYYAHPTRTVYIQHVPLLIEQGRLLATIHHECVHAALALAGPSRLPLWLEEGAAIFFSEQTIGPAPAGARRARTLADLERTLHILTRQNDEAAWLEIRLAHTQARHIVSSLAERQGTAHFVNFLRVLKNGTHFTQALASYYALTPEDLEKWL